MNAHRRGFLAAVLGASMAPALVNADSLMKLWVPPKLVLWGDGVHDDTAALHEFIAGRPVRLAPGSRASLCEAEGVGSSVAAASASAKRLT